MGLDPGWAEDFQRRFDEERAKIGRFNILICGKTGVGKSTLINAIFVSDVAPTGNGVPVTVDTEYFAHDRLPVGVFDTKGFETGEHGDTILERLGVEISRRRQGPINDQVHAVWYVVRSGDRRFEDSQAGFVTRLAAFDLPVLIVLSQVPVRDGHIHPDAIELAAAIESRGLPTQPGPAPILTNARVDPWVTPELCGLHELLDATAEVIPASVRAALEAAQRIDLQRKRRRAKLAIRAATTAAAGTCAVPLPIADAAALFPVQMGMLAAVSAAYGVPTPSSRLVQAFGSIVMATGASTIGRYLAGTIVKFVPGAGSVTGFVIKAGVASSVTLAMGYGWMAVNERLVRMTDEEAAAFLGSDGVKDAFVAAFRDAWTNRKKLAAEIEQDPQ